MAALARHSPQNRSAESLDVLGLPRGYVAAGSTSTRAPSAVAVAMAIGLGAAMRRDEPSLKFLKDEPSSNMTVEPTVISTIKLTDLNPSEREILAADKERWARLGAGAHLEEWFTFYPGILIRRRLAMRMANTDRPRGRGYTTALSQLLRDDGINTNDKNAIKCFTDVAWLHDDPERMTVLRELLQVLTPGERARVNSPITARLRVVAEQKRRDNPNPGPTVRASQIRILTDQVAEQTRTIAHLQEQLAGVEAGSRFDLSRDSVDTIVRVFIDPTTMPRRKAIAIAKGILAAHGEEIPRRNRRRRSDQTE